MRKSVYAVTAFLLALTAVHAAPRAFTVDDIAKLRDVSDPHVSPDGNWVVYAVRSIDAKKDKHETHIWMSSFDGKTTVPLTARAGESESDPRFSPDGRYVSF